MMAYGNALKSTTTDVGELSKLTSSLTLEQTKNVLASKNLNAETVKGVLFSRELNATELQSVTATVAKVGATNTATFSVGAYTAALWENTKAMIASLALNPVAWIAGIAIAIGLATKAYKAFNPTIEEQKEKLDELKESYTSLKDEVDTLGTTIEENDKKIAALQEKMSNHTITLVEEDELNKLRIENDLLQQQYDIKEDLANQKQQEVVEKNAETFNNEFGTYKEPKETDELNIDTYKAFMTAYDNMDSQKFLLLVDENQRMLDEAIASQDARMIESLTKDKELLDTALNEKLLSLTEYQNDLLPLINKDGTFDDSSNQDMWDEVEKWKRTLYERLNQPGDWNTIKIKAVLDKNPLLNVQSLLGKIDTLTEEDINKFFGLNTTLKDANLILTEGQSPAAVFLQYLRSIADTQNSMVTADAPKVFTFDEVLSGLEESYTTLESVKEQWNDTGKVSVDSIQDIMSKFPGLTDLLSDYVQGKKDEKDIINALSEEYATDLENYKLYVAQKNGDDEQFYKNIVDNLSEDLIKKAEYYGIELGNYKSYNEAKLAIDKEYEARKASLQSGKNAVQNNFSKLREQGYGFDKPLPTTDVLSPGIYQNYKQQEEELAEYEKFIEEFNTSITVDIPDFDLDLFKKDDKEKFEDSIDWTENTIQNIEAKIERLNEKIANTKGIDAKIKLLKELKEEQNALASFREKAVGSYKDEYDDVLNELTPKQKKKYQALIESDEEFDIEYFKGKNNGDKEKLFKKVKKARELWRAYQQAQTDYQTSEQDVKDTEKQIKDTDVLERSQKKQKKLESQLDTVNEKLNDSTLSTEDRNALLEQQYTLQKSINDELRIQAKYNKDDEAVAKLDAEDKNKEYQKNSDIYDNNKEDVIRNVSKNDNEIADIQNDIDLAGHGTVEQYDKIINLQKANIGEWEKQRQVAYDMREANKDNAALYELWDNELQDCEDNIYKMNNGIKDMQQAILALPLQDVELKLQSINKEINVLNKEFEIKSDLVNAAIGILDEQIDAQNVIKEDVQDEIDALEKEYELRTASLDVQKAAYELEKVKNNKSAKVFKEGVGFVFEAKAEDVRDAELNYEKAVYERKKQLLEDEIKTADKNIKSLTRQKKQWEDIVTLSEHAALINKAINYDEDFRNKVLSNDLTLLENINKEYKDLYLNIDSLEESKKPYELLQEELTDIAQQHSLSAIKYEEALARTMSALQQYYPELAKKYEQEGTSLEEVAKKQLEGVGVTEESSKDNLETVKGTNEEITQSYNTMLTELEDVFKQLNTMLTTFATNAALMASSVASSVAAISSAISSVGSIDVDIDNVNNKNDDLKDAYTKVDNSISEMYKDIADKLNASIVQNIKPTTTTTPVTVPNTTNNKTTSISFGDINVTGVQNATDFAKAIVSSLPNAMKQELNK